MDDRIKNALLAWVMAHFLQVNSLGRLVELLVSADATLGIASMLDAYEAEYGAYFCLFTIR
jgi:hypothetical protein